MKTKDTVFLPAFYLKDELLLITLKNIPIYIVKEKSDYIGIKGCIV